MLGIILGVCVLLLGVKAFTPDGLPLTRTKKLSGTSAKVIGILCILLGVIFVVDGVFGTARIFALLSGAGR